MFSPSPVDPSARGPVIRTAVVVGLAATLLTGCEALTSHVGVVARANGQELSVEELAGLMGQSQIPVRRDVVQSVADTWVNYQLLGEAAIKHDSLTDRKLIDEVMWPVYTSAKMQKFGRQLAEAWVPDT